MGEWAASSGCCILCRQEIRHSSDGLVAEPYLAVEGPLIPPIR